ncbi:hypothetical protein [Endozoicomonas sp. OPT23]|uniref:hypothetical protein n=1 Tax=Endozoicomonas sp. OPT23 TaxID=2072845 RepID=UPI00129A3DBE|nr:hypothetical protein [Endozoicomonas sp. OPT23]
MLNQLLFFVLLFSFIHPAQAAPTKTRFEHLSDPIRIDWSGGKTTSQASRTFCLQAESSAQPDSLDNSNINYSLRFQDLNGGGNEIVAISKGNRIPINLILVTSSGREEITANRNSASIQSDTLCNVPDLQLIAKASNLDDLPAGDYQAKVRISAFSGVFQKMTEQTLDILIQIPEVIKLTLPKEIVLEDFRNPRKEVNICVNRNGGGSFTLRASAPDSNPGSFEMIRSGQQASRIKYNLEIRNSAHGVQALTPQVPVSGLKGSKNCGSNPLSLIVSVPSSEIEKAYAGSYQGQLTISVGVQ